MICLFCQYGWLFRSPWDWLMQKQNAEVRFPTFVASIAPSVTVLVVMVFSVAMIWRIKSKKHEGMHFALSPFFSSSIYLAVVFCNHIQLCRLKFFIALILWTYGSFMAFNEDQYFYIVVAINVIVKNKYKKIKSNCGAKLLFQNAKLNIVTKL